MMAWELDNGVLILDEQESNPGRLGEDDAIIYPDDNGWQCDLASDVTGTLGMPLPRRAVLYPDAAQRYTTPFGTTLGTNFPYNIIAVNRTTQTGPDVATNNGVGGAYWEWVLPLDSGNDYYIGSVHLDANDGYPHMAFFLDGAYVAAILVAGASVAARRLSKQFEIKTPGIHRIGVVAMGSTDGINSFLAVAKLWIARATA